MTELTQAQKKSYDQLKEIRASKTVALKPCSLLRDKIVGFDGTEEDFRLRYYQVQGVFHMLVLRRMILGDACGLGKTVETIAVLCYLWQTEPNNKVVVVAPKSALNQWEEEIRRFTVDGAVRVFKASDTKGVGSAVHARMAVYRAWQAYKGRAILLLNYAILIRDWNYGGLQPPEKSGKLAKIPAKPGLLDEVTGKTPNLVVVFDEATAFANPRSKTNEIAKFLSSRAYRTYGLTATLLKNHLFEGFGIYQVIRPGLFGTKTRFLQTFCYTRLQSVGKKKIPIILGYRNLDEFRAIIDPFFFGRQKHQVSDELPVLITREVSFGLNSAEESKYAQALEGVLQLGDGELRDFEENKALVSLIYCQQVVDSLALLKFEEGQEIDGHTIGSLGSKEQALLDLFEEELSGEKVIIYTRFETLVGRLQTILKREGLPSVRITGKENDRARSEAQEAFQDLKSDTKIILITNAGSEAINLQAAAAIVFYDAPWSWGSYVQTLGRLIRIGSPHNSVLALHLVANSREGPTIDDHVLTLLRRKKKLIDQILGEAAVGSLDFKRKDTQELIALIQKAARQKRKT